MTKTRPSPKTAPATATALAVAPVPLSLPGGNTVAQTNAGPAQVVMTRPDGLKPVGGSDFEAFNTGLLGGVLAAMRDAPAGGAAEQVVVASAALAAFRPADEIEGMIVAQAVALHHGAMECLRLSMIPEQPAEFCTRLRKDGANLARAMTDMLDALDRKRGKAPQIVRVERVTVNEGGRAFLGNIKPGREGPGG